MTAFLWAPEIDEDYTIMSDTKSKTSRVDDTQLEVLQPMITEAISDLAKGAVGPRKDLK